jgi:uridine phosphorylase
MHAPILEFDPATDAIIEPAAWYGPIDGIPRHCVITWMPDAMQRLLANHEHVARGRFGVESSQADFNEVELEGQRILAALSPIGAAAAATLFEALIGIGCSTFTAIGSSGGLLRDHPPGTVVVPDAMIRDEGVSYHNAPAARHAQADAEMQQSLRSAFAAAGHSPVTGDVWTTDAIFRETADKVATRIDQGAVAVDMEAAALATIASFRSVRIGHAVYLADTLHGDEWDPPELIDRNTDFRYELLLTAARACLAN